MQETVTKCDICGVVKGETNHWWKAQRVGSMISIAPHTPANDLKAEADLCGREHLHQWIDAQLNVIGVN
jgi:hypothetical protein